MITGINSFKLQFEGFEGQYTIIGGTACDILMDEAGETFRATKDIDIVLIVESLTSEFGRKFWEYIIEGGYEHKNKSTGEQQFYRFTNPKSVDYPYMIEIFSRRPDNFILPENAVLTPMPLNDELSSLSAILLNDSYYDFIRNGITTVGGVAVLDAAHLIPLKAKAWLDLNERKRNDPTSVDSKDIKKHKNDVYRLAALLSAETSIIVDGEIDNDIRLFVDSVKDDNVNLKQIGIRGINQNDIIQRITNVYNLDNAVPH